MVLEVFFCLGRFQTRRSESSSMRPMLGDGLFCEESLLGGGGSCTWEKRLAQRDRIANAILLGFWEYLLRRSCKAKAIFDRNLCWV